MNDPRFGDEHNTLVDLLRWRAAEQPPRGAYTFLIDGEDEEVSLSYRELDRRARSIASLLRDQGARPGDRVLLLHPPGLEYIAAFFGCLYARVVAVPIYPPRPRSLNRLLGVTTDALADLALTTAAALPQIERRVAGQPGLGALRVLASDGLPDEWAGSWADPGVDADDLAFLQYTSGSTSAPKGVMVSHSNLLNNQRLIRARFGHNERTVVVGWLPLYHDMGLIGNVFQPLYLGIPCILMAPAAFIQRPIRWLRAISRYRATTSGGPSFAYDLCLQQVTPEQVSGLDLSCWQVAFNGAEPIRAETLRRFSAAFGPAGFRREAFYPCYGLAEGTLLVVGNEVGTPPVLAMVWASELMRGRVVAAPDDDGGGRAIVGCGRVLDEPDVRVVDPEARNALPDDQVGEIWVAGPSNARGYWNRPEETDRVFQARLADDAGPGPFLRTGDLGFIREGQLFVTGRAKDLIIIRGLNHYPHDIELTAQRSHPGLRPNAGAAFAVEAEGRERLVVVQEVGREHLQDLNVAGVTAAIRRAISAEHDLQVAVVALVRPGSVPMTSSGKVQRRACRADYLAGRLNSVGLWEFDDEAAPDRADGHAPPCDRPTADVPSSEALESWLVARVAARLRSTPRAIDTQAPFAQLGLGSLDVVELSGELEGFLGRRLSPTLLYDHPSIAALARHLAGEPGPEAPTAARAGDATATADESIAVIGLGCRFPGADGPVAFWRLLHEGGDAIGTVPPERWDVEAYYDPDPAAPGKMYTRHGGFLDGPVDRFDAAFFGISPREAASLDPQQRLLLEVAWEALEHAGQAPDRLADSPTGVFVGISSTDYALRHIYSGDPTRIDPYSGTGIAPSVAIGRLSHVLGLRGPSLAVDTACSSSLVAVHLACQSLRAGECRLALAGGVNLILTPEGTIYFCKVGALSPEGRCKTFDAAADGYVRGEGCGIVVLKRLADAVAGGDPILALIRGSAVNHDGRSFGLTVPNGVAQQALIRAALDRAGVEPAAVDYVEAHGTGTPLGDPIELRALAAALGPGRDPDRPLAVGSVKTNIGHLEAAAGVAGLIKAVLALHHGEIPPHRHLERPSDHVPWGELPLEVPTRRRPWAGRAGRPRVAGVSAFGFSGTNAHVVLAEAPRPAHASTPTDADRPIHLLALSAKTETALREQATRYEHHLAEHPDDRLADVCSSAGTGRAHLAHRLTVVAGTPAEMRAGLADFAAGRGSPLVRAGRVPYGRRARVAFLFDDQATLAAGVGRQLARTQPAFRRILDRCDLLLRPHLTQSLLTVLDLPPGTADPPVGPAVVLPALFALEYALAQLWRDWGVQPSAVMGCGVGELVAACVAGMITLEDGIELAARWGRLAEAPAAGDATARVASDFGHAVERVRFSPPTICFISAPSGQDAGEVDVTSADYWRNRPQMPVHLPADRPALAAAGCEIFLEIGPGASLVEAGRRILTGEANLWLTSFQQQEGRDDWDSILGTLSELYVRGIDVDWAGFDREHARSRVALPTYPFDRQRHWIDAPRAPGAGAGQPTSKALAGEDVSGWMYQIQWRPSPQPVLDAELAAAPPAGSWLIFADRDGLGTQLAERARRRGDRCVLVRGGDTYASIDDSTFQLDPGRVDDFERLLREAPTAEGTSWRGLLYLWGLDEPEFDPAASESAQAVGCIGLLHLIQALVRARLAAAPRLWAVTRGAQAFRPGAEPITVAQAPLWGLGKVAAQEHPEVWGGLIDLDPEGRTDEAEELLQQFRHSGEEDQWVLRGGGRFVPRLVRSPEPARELCLRPDGTYLITGGLGGLGLAVAGLLAARGARHLALLGRRPPSEAATAALDRLRAKGVEVLVLAADVSRRTELAEALTHLDRALPPLRGVIHAAGVLDDATLTQLSARRLRDVLSPKVLGSWHLHELTAGMALDFFVLFSSTASVLGSAGQGNYAAANAFLDALAHRRRAAGLPGLSINWGPWADVGMAAARNDQAARRWAALGIQPIAPEDGLRALEKLLPATSAQVAVARVDWDRLIGQLVAGRAPPLLAELPRRAPGGPRPDRALRLAEARPGERRALLLAHVRDEVAAVLHLDPEEHIDSGQGLFDMGLDSLMAVELRNRLKAGLDLADTLTSTVIIDHPSLEALVDHLAELIVPGVAPTAGDAPGRLLEREDELIAVIGLGCRFPGGGDGPDAFWRSLCAGVDAVREVPASRWDVEAYYDPDPEAPGKTYARHGAFLDHVDQFDAAFFGISPREAASLDPQQRLLLEVAWEALEHAGQAPDRLADSPTGVFVGISGHDYAQLLEGDPALIDAHVGTGNTASIAAGRLSYVLGLRGPSLAVDTACSSSLVAVHLACQSLRAGECRLALAGGVNLILTPETTLYLSKARALSPEGRCKTFDAAADGYVRGEGCGIVVLKRLADAVAGGDPILALIRGSAVNHDGRTASLTAPNGLAQVRVIRAALDRAGVEPAAVDYVEAHGTGTPLGDPIELRALAAALGPGRDPDRPLAVGSVKTNIGHLEAAAGVAGLIKAVLALHHGEIPPHRHLERPSDHVPWGELPLEVPTRRRPWAGRAGRPRVAGVSAFGFSGTNAHVVLAEAPPPEPTRLAEGAGAPALPAYLLPLSARSPEALLAMAGAYRDQLTALTPEAQGTLTDLCYTASIRRAHHPNRAVVTGRSTDELAEGLAALAGRQAHPALCRGDRAPDPRRTLVFAFADGDWEGRWLGGAMRLRAEEPIFRAAIEACERTLKGLGSEGLAGRLSDEVRAEADPVCRFVAQVALASLWRSWGVEPDAVLGQGLAEVAAAHVAGSLGLEQATRIVLDHVKADGPAPRPALDAPTLLPGPTPLFLASLDGRKSDGVDRAGDLPAGSALAGAVPRAVEARHDISLQIGPRPDPSPPLDCEARSHPERAVVLAGWPTAGEGRLGLLRSLGVLYALGHPVPWDRLYPSGGRCVSLPRYPWQHQRHWLDRAPRRGTDPAPAPSPLVATGEWHHPFLGRRLHSPLIEGLLFERPLDIESLPLLGDHRLGGQVVVAGAVHVALALTAAAEALEADACVLEGVQFTQAITIPAAEGRVAQLVLERRDALSTPFQVFSREPVNETPWVQNVAGTLRVGPGAVPAGSAVPFSLDATRARLGEEIAGADFYGRMATAGYHLGPRFRWIEAIWRRDGEALCRIRAGEPSEAGDGAVIHPGLIDSCFQATGLAMHREGASRFATDDAIYVPSAIDRLWSRGRPQGPLWCHIRPHAGGEPRRPEEAVLDIALYDEAGQRCLLAMDGFRARRVALRALQGQEDRPSEGLFYEVDWEPAEPAHDDDPTVPVPGTWLILGDGAGLGQRLAALLEFRDQSSKLARSAIGQVVPPGQFRHLLRDLAASGHPPLRGIIDLGALDLEASDGAPPAGNGAEACAGVLLLVQALAQAGLRDAPRLWMVTRGVHPVDGSSPSSASQAPLWGLGRTISHEFPELSCTKVDLGPDSDPEQEALLLVQELIAGSPEDQVALRGDRRYVARLVRWSPTGAEGTPPPPMAPDGGWIPAGAKNFRLETAKLGVLDHLVLRSAPRRPPGPGEVEIRVQAAGLNFLDVLLALGVIPDDAPGLDGAGPGLGAECAGEVVALGDGVGDLAVGDPVLALAPASFAPYVTTSRHLVARTPAHLTAEEAATIPIAFLTAYYGLDRAGRLARGERVLIHAAAGGVGLAAVQLAQRAGAEIFATAGSPQKRQYLAALGVQHLMDSRSLTFADQVLAATEGQGVDVVLNSLAGEALTRSFGLLRDFGRFIEIGKRDYYEDNKLGLRPFLKNLSFTLVDLRAMTRQHPERIGVLLSEVVGMFEQGRLQPLPHRVFPIAEAAGAFQHMAQARHIGKIVLSLRDAATTQILPAPVPAAPARAGAMPFRPDATYLIVGGLGGLGLTVAGWMADQGARNLVLVGRGQGSEEARRRLEGLRGDGVRVEVAQTDVASAEELAGLLERIDREMPPLRGVIHAAAVLDDGGLLQLDAGRFGTVLAPKVAGAWNLHRLTEGRSLDFFLLFSSAASLLGAPGQANYAAANAYLDALAHLRRARGLPALAINWGPWSEVGLAVAQAERGRRLVARGIGGLTTEKGLEALGHLLRRGQDGQVGVMHLDLRRWRQFYPRSAESPFLSRLDGGTEGSPDRRGGAFRRLLLDAAPGERLALLEANLLDQFAQVLGLDPSRLDVDTPLGSLGIDSLLALELRNRLEMRLGLELSATLIWSHRTIAALVRHLATELDIPLHSGTPAANGSGTSPEWSDAELAEVAALSPAEVERLLGEALGRTDDYLGGD